MSKVDKKIFQAIDYLKDTGQLRFNKDFADALGIHRQLLNNIKSGKQSFTVDHIVTMCKKFNINASFLFGQTEEICRKNVKSLPSKKSAA